MLSFTYWPVRLFDLFAELMNNYFLKLTNAHVPGFVIGVLFFPVLFFSSCHNEQKKNWEMRAMVIDMCLRTALLVMVNMLATKHPVGKNWAALIVLFLEKKLFDFQQDSVHAAVMEKHTYGPKEIRFIYLYLQRLATHGGYWSNIHIPASCLN